MKLLFSLALGLLFISCQPADKSESAAKNDASPSSETANAATISASPKSATGSGPLGETTITWDTGTGAPGEVYVSKNKGEEKRFAEGQSGSKKAPWISPHAHFEFRLYQGTEHKELLGKVDVTKM
ncbi:MAG: hypothetical protein ACR2G0_08770 [Chthoniobacterales bacterium]